MAECVGPDGGSWKRMVKTPVSILWFRWVVHFVINIRNRGRQEKNADWEGFLNMLVIKTMNVNWAVSKQKSDKTKKKGEREKKFLDWYKACEKFNNCFSAEDAGTNDSRGNGLKFKIYQQALQLMTRINLAPAKYSFGLRNKNDIKVFTIFWR